jgi:hypothetical protein
VFNEYIDSAGQKTSVRAAMGEFPVPSLPVGSIISIVRIATVVLIDA